MLSLLWCKKKKILKMRLEEQLTIDQKLREVAEILYNNTPDEELATFETKDLKFPILKRNYFSLSLK